MGRKPEFVNLSSNGIAFMKLSISVGALLVAAGLAGRTASAASPTSSDHVKSQQDSASASEPVDIKELPPEMRAALEKAMAEGGGRHIELPPEAAASLMAEAARADKALAASWIGKAFPLERVVGLDGAEHVLRGRRHVVNFWATWCAPCLDEMPVLQAFAEQHSDFGVVTISGDFTRDALQAYLAKKPLQLPIIYDEGRSIVEMVKVSSWPTTFVLDAEGRVESVFGSFSSVEDLVGKLDAAKKDT